MRVAFRIVCRMIGVLNLCSCAFGVLAMISLVPMTLGGGLIQSAIQKHPQVRPLDIELVCVVGMVLSFLLLVAVIITAIKLIRLSRDAVTSYCTLVGICLLCWFIGEAGAFATGPSGLFFLVITLANLGDFGFLFPPPLDWYLVWRLPVYPILSSFLLFLILKQVNSLDNAKAAADIPLSS